MVVLAMLSLSLAPIALNTFHMCEHFFVSQRYSIENEVFEKVMDRIESKLLSEELPSSIAQIVFTKVMQELKELELLQEKSYEKGKNSVPMKTQPIQKEKKFANNAFAPDEINSPGGALLKQKRDDFSETMVTYKKTQLLTSKSKILETKHESIETNLHQMHPARSRTLQSNETYTSCNGTFFRFDLELNTAPNETSWYLMHEHENSFEFNSYEEQDQLKIKTYEQCLEPGPYSLFLMDSSENGNNSTSTYYASLLPGIYSISLFPLEQSDAICDEIDHCYKILINDEIIVNGSSFSDTVAHSIAISSDGIARERRCHERPLLASMNHVNHFHYDDRIEKIMNVIQIASSIDALSNFETPQSMAACWIIFDDIIQMSWDDELILQRYIVAVLLYSTNQNAEIMMLDKPEVCDIIGIKCNGQRHVVNIVMRKYMLFLAMKLYCSFMLYTNSFEMCVCQ